DNKDNTDPANRDPLHLIESTVTRVSQMLPGSIPENDAQRIVGLVADHKKRVQLAEDRAQAVKELTERSKKTGPGAALVKDARQFIREKARVIPGFEADAEVLTILG